MTAKRRGRPAWTAPKLIAANDTVSLPVPGSQWPQLEHVHVVVYEDAEGRSSRRVYLSLHSASAAVARAEKRGVSASLVLCRIVPAGDPE
jgi:hypothetical protein